MTTIIILICLIFGAAIGLALGWLLIPKTIDDAWHQGYQAALDDFAESPEAMATPSIYRRDSGLPDDSRRVS